jgi:hypothetical protein
MITDTPEAQVASTWLGTDHFITEDKSVSIIAKESSALSNSQCDKNQGAEKSQGNRKGRFSIRSFFGRFGKHSRNRESDSEWLLKDQNTASDWHNNKSAAPMTDTSGGFSSNPVTQSDGHNPFNTPPQSPTLPNRDGSPLSQVTDRPGRTNTTTDFEERKGARLRSGFKALRILGVEATSAVVEQMRIPLTLTIDREPEL